MRLSSACPGLAVFAALLATALPARSQVVPRLVADLLPGSPQPDPLFPANVPITGGIGELLPAGDQLFLSAFDGAHGLELWHSDGTAAGTGLVLDLEPGARSSFLRLLTPLHGGLLFSSGRQLWWTDGSAENTVLLHRTESLIVDAIPFGDLAAFLSCSAEQGGCRLWTTDGTFGDTQPLRSDVVWPGTSGEAMAAVGDELLFLIAQVDDRQQLWAYRRGDGMLVPVTEFVPGFFPGQLRTVGSRVVFDVFGPGGEELWASDGTAEGTVPIYTASHRELRPARGLLGGALVLFSAELGPTGLVGCRLLATDGTAAGTFELATLPLSAGAACPDDGVADQGRVLFGYFTEAAGWEPWVSDGTQGGTHLFEDLVPGPGSSSPRSWNGISPGVVFNHGDNDILSIIAPGAQTATELLAGIPASQVVRFAGEIYGGGTDVEAGNGPIFANDGTAPGTRIVTRIGSDQASSSPSQLGRRADDVVMLAAQQLGYYPLPFRSDGSSGGTVPAADSSPRFAIRSSSPPALVALPAGALWKTGGAFSSPVVMLDAAGAEPVPDLFVSFLDPVRLGDRALFAADNEQVGNELFVTDGTLAGTGLFTDVDPGSQGDPPFTSPRSSNPSFLTLFRDRIYFATSSSLGGEGLWSTALDGSDARPLPGFPPNSPDDVVVDIVAAGSNLFVEVAGSLDWLWRVDPVTGGLTLAALPDAGPDHRYALLERVPFKGRLAIHLRRVAGEENTPLTPVDEELWLLDGTREGMVRLFSRQQVTRDHGTWQLTPLGDRLFFTPELPNLGRELWTTDESTRETRAVADLVPGPAGSEPHNLRALDGLLLFDAAQPEQGSELWRTDGTAEGTQRLFDLAPGVRSGDPSEPTALADQILFAGYRDDVGRELFAFDRTELLRTCEPSTVAVCLGGGRFRVSVDWLDRVGDQYSEGVGSALTDDSATFWFFDPDNTELVVKVLDGTEINQHHWVYYGALSDVAYWITVFDTLTGATVTYANEQGTICGKGDVDALLEDPERVALFPGEIGTPAGTRLAPATTAAPAKTLPISASAGAASAACVRTEHTACLLDDRFAVDVIWQTARHDGLSGVAEVVGQSGDSGFFWFFDPANVELIVKVLDGRDINGNFWVYFGALSDVEYHITVTDTATGAQKVYDNEEGDLCGGADVEAFPGA